MGLSRRPCSAILRRPARSEAIPPPLPPSVKAGRTTSGRPSSAAAASTSSEVVRQGAARHAQAQLFHGGAEELPVLGLGDRLAVGADHLDRPQIEDAALLELHRQVEGRLAAQRGQQRIRPFALDDARERAHIERLDVRAGGKVRVGHDRRRVRVDEHDLETVLGQDLAGLRA